MWGSPSLPLHIRVASPLTKTSHLQDPPSWDKTYLDKNSAICAAKIKQPIRRPLMAALLCVFVLRLRWVLGGEQGLLVVQRDPPNGDGGPTKPDNTLTGGGNSFK